MRIKSRVSDWRGTPTRGTRNRSSVFAKGDATEVGNIASHFRRGASAGFGWSDWSFVEPGTAKSTQGQSVSAVAGTGAKEPAPPATCASQPTQWSVPAAISTEMHPSGSMQSTKPWAGVTPVTRAAMRQSQAAMRWRAGVNTAGRVHGSAARAQALKVWAVLSMHWLRGETRDRAS